MRRLLSDNELRLKEGEEIYRIYEHEVPVRSTVSAHMLFRLVSDLQYCVQGGKDIYRIYEHEVPVRSTVSAPFHPFTAVHTSERMLHGVHANAMCEARSTLGTPCCFWARTMCYGHHSH